jgi:hypothetical protein
MMESHLASMTQSGGIADPICVIYKSPYVAAKHHSYGEMVSCILAMDAVGVRFSLVVCFCSGAFRASRPPSSIRMHQSVAFRSLPRHLPWRLPGLTLTLEHPHASERRF